MMRAVVVWGIALAWAPAVWSQGEGDPADTAAPPTHVAANPGADAEGAAADTEAAGREQEGAADAMHSGDDAVDALVRRVEQQAADVAALRAALHQATARIDALEEHQVRQEVEASEDRLDLYGFFTTIFNKQWIPKGSVLNGPILSSGYFAVTDVNLYLSAHLSPTFSALVEVVFSFLPQGVVAAYFPEYERVDTTVNDLRSGRNVTLGSLFIERAYATWQPTDYFGVTAGRFFTPYGIWAYDHSALAVLPPRLPYLVVREGVPVAQTGLMLHGSAFPARHLTVKYALTVSNGRGPTEAVYDLNENKALGLRLRAEVANGAFRAAVGGYGYWGVVRDAEETMEFLTARFSEKTVARYTEWVGALDAEIRYGSAFVQGEYLRGLTRYSKRPQWHVPTIPSLSLANYYQPDFVQWDAYLLAGYDFHIGDGGAILTPWVMPEYSVYQDVNPDLYLRMITVGLTVRPRHFASIKVSGYALDMPRSEVAKGDTAYGATGQLAVAF